MRTRIDELERARGWRVVVIVVLAAPQLLWAAPAAAARYELVPAKCSLVVRLFKDGLGARFAHDHVIRARALAGAVRYDPARPAAAKVSVTVDARRLEADAPALRRRYKLKTMLSPADRREVERKMKAAGQLHVERHRQIRFVSTGVGRAPQGKLRIAGKLTLRGVTRKVSLRARVRLVSGGRILKAAGQLRFRQSAFGYQPYSAGLGLVKVKDRVVLDIYLEARRKQP